MRNRTMGLLCVAVVISACGSKAPATPDATASTAPATTSVPAAPDAGLAPTSGADGGAAAVADAAGAGAPEASVAADDAAAAPGETAVAVPLPADLPVVPGLAPEVVARALGGAAGCVGIAKSGRAVLSIIEAEVDGAKARELRFTDTATPDRQYKDQGLWRFAACEGEACGAKMREIIQAEELAELVKAHRFVACRDTLTAKDVSVIEKSVPIAVASSDDTLQVAIDGSAPLVFAKGGELVDAEYETAYWADEVGAIFVRVAQKDAGFDGSRLIAIGATELGESPCVPRPLGPKAVEVEPVPAFDPQPASPSCVAMTPDGKMAAFKIFRTGEGAAPNEAVWFGVGTAPELDLTCLVRSCKKPERDRMAEAAAKAGLIGCHEARGTVAIDGWATPWMYKGNEVKLKTTGGWRVVHRLAMAAHDGGDHEELWKVFQFSAGGPIFLYLGNADTGFSESRVTVLNDGEMALCSAPLELLRVAEVRASSAAKDGGGYKFGPPNVADGDWTTSWQPAAGKAGDQAPWIELTFAEEQTVAQVAIANGFQRKDGNGDLFALNARAAEATLAFSDGSTEKLTFGADERGLKAFTFAPRKVKSVKVTITALHAGSKWPGDVALSEVRVFRPPMQ